MQKAPEKQTANLYVDLDGTLVNTDLLYETWMLFLKKKPLLWFMPLIWLLGGRAKLKAKLAEVALPDPATLPYNQDFLDHLHDEKKAGRALYLATAADQQVAESVAAHLGIFESVLASRTGNNLLGKRKAIAISEHAAGKPFFYAGDSKNDLPVWSLAIGAVTVGASRQLAVKAASVTTVVRSFQNQAVKPKIWLKAMRVHQWVKNLLLFIPLITAHAFFEIGTWLSAATAFAAFCLVSSATYISNDLLDLGADRLHQTKRNRPFAAGHLSIRSGLVVSMCLLAAGIAMTFLLPRGFTWLLLIYVATSTSYSLYLKTIPLVDVFILAGLFTLRIFCGAEAIAVPLSQWLLAFSMFFFISLAMVKRYAELHNLKAKNGHATPGRGYLIEDQEHLGILGVVSGGLAVLIMALYLTSPDVKELYRQPELLWFICPMLFYWLAWIWLTARRGRMHEDPVIFAVKDRTSYITGALVGALLLLAI